MPNVKKEIPPLPSLNEFALSSIMESIPSSKINDLKGSIETANTQYATDIGDQMNQLVQIQQGILLKLDGVDHEYKVLHTKLELDISDAGDGDKIEIYSKIGDKFGTIVNGIIDQRKRIDKLINRLKVQDKKFMNKNGGASLFDVNSENKDKFKELYEKGMKNETKVNEIPNFKLQQYLDVEMQLDEIDKEQHMKKFEKFKNPTTELLLNEIALTGVSDEVIIVHQLDNPVTKTTEHVLDELKKFNL